MDIAFVPGLSIVIATLRASYQPLVYYVRAMHGLLPRRVSALSRPAWGKSLQDSTLTGTMTR